MMIIELEDEHESFQKYQDHVAVHRALREKIHAAVEIYKIYQHHLCSKILYEQDVQDAWRALEEEKKA